MKKYISIFLTAVLLMPFATSCEKWLEEHPYSIATDTFYNTAAEADAAIASVSRKFYNTYVGDFNFPSMLECFADNIYGRGSWAANSEYTVLNPTNYGRSDGFWNNFYSIIRDANIVISRIPEATDLTEAQKTSYIAEARFFRGYAYTSLARYYGKAVLRTEENMTEWDQPLTPGATIYNFALEDLKFAVQNCPDKAATDNRPSKDAARAALAEFYLIQKDHASAKPLLEAIISSGKYSLVPVKTSRDFDNLFGYTVTSTPEEVFYGKTSDVGAMGFAMVMMYSHPSAIVNGAKMLKSGGWYGLCLSSENKWIKEWDDNDLRKNFVILPFQRMGEFDGLPLDALMVKFYDHEHSGSYACTCDNPIYRYADILIMEAECINETSGPNEQAMEYLNMIHRRAYGYTPNQPSEVDYKLADYNTKDKFMELLVKEHSYEFIGEAKRWNFLVRTGLANKYVKEYKGRDINPNMMLFRIPESEFNYNAALDPSKDQNPGY